MLSDSGGGSPLCLLRGRQTDATSGKAKAAGSEVAGPGPIVGAGMRRSSDLSTSLANSRKVAPVTACAAGRPKLPRNTARPCSTWHSQSVNSRHE